MAETSRNNSPLRLNNDMSQLQIFNITEVEQIDDQLPSSYRVLNDIKELNKELD